MKWEDDKRMFCGAFGMKLPAQQEANGGAVSIRDLNTIAGGVCRSIEDARKDKIYIQDKNGEYQSQEKHFSPKANNNVPTIKPQTIFLVHFKP